jgi:hypothetical protein
VQKNHGYCVYVAKDPEKKGSNHAENARP